MQGIGRLLCAVPVQFVQGAQVRKYPGGFSSDFSLSLGEKLGYPGCGIIGFFQQFIHGGEQCGTAAFPQTGQKGMDCGKGKLPGLQIGHGVAKTRQAAGQKTAKTGLLQVEGEVFQQVSQVSGKGDAKA